MRRLFASGALLVWCALAAVIPAADAMAERASSGSRAHIEAAGGGAKCVPVHDHLACQLCRMLRLASNGPAPASSLLVLRVAIAPPTAQHVSLPVKRVERSASPRAPPIA